MICLRLYMFWNLDSFPNRADHFSMQESREAAVWVVLVLDSSY